MSSPLCTNVKRYWRLSGDGSAENQEFLKGTTDKTRTLTLSDKYFSARSTKVSLEGHRENAMRNVFIHPRVLCGWSQTKALRQVLARFRGVKQMQKNHCSTQKYVKPIISLFETVPSPRGGFGGLSPPNKVPSPQIEIWNTINHWSFYQMWISSLSRHKRKGPPQERKAPRVKTSWRRFWFERCWFQWVRIYTLHFSSPRHKTCSIF